jgi:hypothetical protein
MFNRHNFNQKTQPNANFAFKNNNLNNLFNNTGSSIFYPEVNKNDEYFMKPKHTMNTSNTSNTSINQINKVKEEIIKDESTQAYMIIEEYLDSQGISRNHVFDKIVDYIYRNELAKNRLDENNLTGKIYQFVNDYFVMNNINHDYFINSVKKIITNPSIIGKKITYNWENLKGSEDFMIAKLSNTIYKSFQSTPIQTSIPTLNQSFTQPQQYHTQPHTPSSLDVHSLFKNIMQTNTSLINKNKDKSTPSCCDLEARIDKLENIINELTNEINVLKKNQIRTSELETQLNDISSIINQASIYSDDSSDEEVDYSQMPPLIADDACSQCINNKCHEEYTDEKDECDVACDIVDETDDETVDDKNGLEKEFDLNKFMNNAEKIGKTIAIEFIKSFKLPFNNQ